jgi:hypothetical protein
LRHKQTRIAHILMTRPTLQSEAVVRTLVPCAHMQFSYGIRVDNPNAIAHTPSKTLSTCSVGENAQPYAPTTMFQMLPLHSSKHPQLKVQVKLPRRYEASKDGRLHRWSQPYSTQCPYLYYKPLVCKPISIACILGIMLAAQVADGSCHCSCDVQSPAVTQGAQNLPWISELS